MINNLVKYEFSSNDKLFFTSDTHFGHANILKYCNRPFTNIQEHDEEIVKRWNEVVPEDGIVFHLGDIGFCSETYLRDILEKLNGKIYWIIGNHDWRRITKAIIPRFECITQQMVIRIGSHNIVYLNHFKAINADSPKVNDEITLLLKTIKPVINITNDVIQKLLKK